MIKQYLFTPGPTPIPSEVAAAMSQPIIHHRTAPFSKAFEEVRRGLRKLFGTKNDVLILASSGTGAMEAGVSNLLSPGEKALIVNGGKFGERWLRICKAYGIEPVEIKVQWGKAVTVEAVAKALKEHPDAKALLIQASETSTSVLHPVEEIAGLTQNGPLLVVDGITAVGVLPMPQDQWGIDVLITGSQKALMLPPGLGFISVNERAWKRVEASKSPRFYFDLRLERKSQNNGETAFTPAISLILGLRTALELIEREGLEQVYKRHDRLARATRAGVTALGLELLAPEDPSPALTGLYVPEKIDGGKLLNYLLHEMGVAFAGGQDHLVGKILRIAHLGYLGSFDVVMGIGALEMALKKFGHRVTLGRGVGAAQEILMEALEG